MAEFKSPHKMSLTERRRSVHSLIAPSAGESFDGGTTARGRVGDWRADEKHSSFHQPAVFLVGCSDYSAGEIESVAPPAIIFHDNIANLIAATDINCLTAMQYAVEVCRVQSIVVRGHHGCRGVAAAIENRGLDILSNWLRPVARLAAEYESLLEQINKASDRRDALCELNVIEQVHAACRSTVTQTAWKNGRELSVNGLIDDRQNRLLENFQIRVSGNDSLDAAYSAAIADFAARWNCRLKS